MGGLIIYSLTVNLDEYVFVISNLIYHVLPKELNRCHPRLKAKVQN